MIIPFSARRELSEFNPPLLAPRSLEREVGMGSFRRIGPVEAYGLRLGIPLPGMGMGDVSSQQINALVTTGATTTVGILAGLHAVIGGVALAGPVGAGIAGLIAVASLMANMFHGCGQTCVAATQDANKAASLLQQNLDAYRSAPVHYESMQQAALNNVDMFFAALKQACSDPSLGDAGRRCISERLVRGGSAPWCPTGTGCDWFIQYRDPISNDPTVQPDPSPVSAISNAVNSVVGGSGGFNWASVALPAGLLLAGVFIFAGGGSK